MYSINDAVYLIDRMQIVSFDKLFFGLDQILISTNDLIDIIDVIAFSFYFINK